MWELVCVVHRTHDEYHVLPVADLKPHTTTKLCWCCPEVDDESGDYVHNSYDRREDYETGKRKLN